MTSGLNPDKLQMCLLSMINLDNPDEIRIIRMKSGLNPDVGKKHGISCVWMVCMISGLNPDEVWINPD